MEKKNNLDPQYNKLLEDILENGTKKQTRNGEVISVFGRQIRHKMSDGFPLLTCKRMFFRLIATELLWFLRGDTNIKYLVDNDCHIWDGDAYKNYCEKINLPPTRTLPLGTKVIPTLYTQEEFINKIKTDAEFAKKWGDLGPVYGKQWRSWEGKGDYRLPDKVSDWVYTESGLPVTECQPKQIDQIQNLIHDLKTNPDSRRNRVNAWNVGELDEMVLPPCHTDFQFFTRVLSENERRSIFPELNEMYLEKKNHIEHYDFDGAAFYREKEKSLLETLPTRAISLMWNQRSVDTFLGLPFNIASYGLLLEIIAKEVNMVPDELIGNLGDTHLYLNHIEQAKEQIGRDMNHDEKVEYARSLYGNEEWWNINDKKVIDILHSNKRTREPYPLPTLKINDEFWNPDADLLSNLPHIQITDFYVDNYQSHPAIKAPLSN